MKNSMSRRGVLRLSAVAAVGAAGMANVVSGSESAANGVSLPPTVDADTLVAATLTTAGAVAVVHTDGNLVLRSFAQTSNDPTLYAASGDLAVLPGSFEPSGLAVSGDVVSIFGGDWGTVQGEAFERGTGGLSVPAVAESTTIQVSPSTEFEDRRILLPTAYEYSTTSESLTRVPSPTLARGEQGMFLETLLPGAASIVALADEDDIESVRIALGLWGLDGTLVLGAIVGLGSAVEDLILPIGAGSLFAFTESGGGGPSVVTPTLLGLVPLGLSSKAGSLVAAARTSTGSIGILQDAAGAYFKWAPLSGWTALPSLSVAPDEFLVGLAGGAPDPVFAAATGASSFRLITI